jgi:hypothetical protein
MKDFVQYHNVEKMGGRPSEDKGRYHSLKSTARERSSGNRPLALNLRRLATREARMSTLARS